MADGPVRDGESGDTKVSLSQWQLVWKEFRKRRLNLVGMGIILSIFAVAFFADFLASDRPILLYREGQLWVMPNLTRPPELGLVNNAWLLSGGLRQGEWALVPPVPYGPREDIMELGTRRLESPSIIHPLGTDDRGRDVAARMIHGTRVTLAVGIFAVALYVAIGVLLGSLAGYFGGKIDDIISRATEILLSFPSLFLILTIQAMLETTEGWMSVLQLVAVLGVTRWTSVSRLVRAEIMRAKGLDYVVAAQAQGLSTFRIITRYLLPNALGPVMVSATFGIAGAVLIESSLSFLGFGVQPPMASWGELLQQARETQRIWLILYPGLAVFISVTAYNLAGEGLRDAVDPRLRGVG